MTEVIIQRSGNPTLIVGRGVPTTDEYLVQYRNQALAAKDDAVAAKTLAEGFKNNAITAKDEAVTAKDGAITALNSANSVLTSIQGLLASAILLYKPPVVLADDRNLTIDVLNTGIAIQINTQVAGELYVETTGTPIDGQLLFIEIKSDEPQTFIWGDEFIGSGSLDLPAETSGDGVFDVMQFVFSETASAWLLIQKNFDGAATANNNFAISAFGWNDGGIWDDANMPWVD